jgi:tetratricopeptide (TPR) repeat protein
VGTALCFFAFGLWPSASAVPQRGLTAVELVASAYDVTLNADFERMPLVLERTCGAAPEVACQGLRALATWWEILLDPQSRFLDARFLREVGAAIEGATAWTRREPERAEAWFYLGAALGARGQWRVLREERLSAARDGKRIKAALERALALDPQMHDATFGIGAYRYYAAVAPSYLRWLRWLLLLPGGDRAGGLAQMEQASRLGQLVRAEAQYQLHVVYLWYEGRFMEALALVRGLRDRYPRNPLYRQIEAEILDVYVHDSAASLAASEDLLDAVEHGDVNRGDLAAVRARLNIAVQLDRLGQRDRARATLQSLLSSDPHAPIDAVARARALQRAWTAE